MAKESKTVVNYNDHAKAGGFYFMAFIGAAWYFIQMSDGFWEVILALLKAAVWPVFLVHRVFVLLRI